ncbi:GNAT family N-acetyltransferase [Ancylobacter terrae]|uniref:GNAT family N-acetyltransferase n=1 Tax=Ancylobacter sp. sgz301288 TaxID=3342077 RepID=UPI00385B8930
MDQPTPPAAPPPLLNLDGYTPVPAGKIAAIVTHLEMTARPAPMPEPALAGLSLVHVPRPALDWYRALFREIGENWLWFSRLQLGDDALGAILADPAVELHALRRDGADVGLVEIDFRRLPEEAELAFVGIVAELTGSGAGRFLMNRAMELVWARAPRRLTVHTCTLDHPAAVGFYQRAGFRALARSVEIADDPRLMGVLPRGAAPGVPVIER